MIDRKEERTRTDGTRKGSREETGMTRSRYVFTVTTPPMNEETADAFRFLNQIMVFGVIVNSHDGDGYELRPVLQDAAKQIPQEKEQMTDGEQER